MCQVSRACLSAPFKFDIKQPDSIFFAVYKKYFKRPLDFLLALLLILALSPVYLAVYVLVRLNMGSPVIFRQARPGLNNKIFYILKFRSMNSRRDSKGELLPDAERLTKLGAFLRKTSLDEIPQFFCVLRGDMSFIGPRPLLPQYLAYYTPEESRRSEVRPGITGLAQINGRNCISWDEKLAYDVEYVDNVTFLGDLKIALKTVVKTFASSGVRVGVEESLNVVRSRRAAGERDSESSSGKKE